MRTPEPSIQTSERPREVQNPAPRAAADGSPSLEEIVRIAHDAGHSDVHLGVGEVPRYRALVEAGRIDGNQAVAISLKPNELAQVLRGRS